MTISAIAPLTSDAIIAALEAALGPGAVLPGADALPFCTDWTRRVTGDALCVVLPRNTDEVARCVRIAASHGAKVVPQGGNTGLAYGAIPSGIGPEIILSLTRLRAIRALDPLDLTLTAEGGLTLQAAQDAARAQGCDLPITLGARGSATLGGMIATNAGGNLTLRHGTMRDLILGLEVVLPDGTVWDGLRQLRKDNTGYALRHLFAGSEGTLGIITAATLRLVPAATSTALAIAALPDETSALALLEAARRSAGDTLNAFEYLSGDALRLATAQLRDARDPFEAAYPHYVLIELATSRRGVDLKADLETLLAAAHGEGLIRDAAIAASETQREAVWRLREGQAEAELASGPHLKTDLSVPVSRTARLLQEARAACLACLPAARVVPYGHLGDGNIHFNVVAPPGMDATAFAPYEAALTAAILDLARSLDGSFSAEHGVGAKKRHSLAAWRSPTELSLMQRIKDAIDPQALLNPGKLLPSR